MAFADFLQSVQKQLAALCSRTDENGAALPDLPITLDGEEVTVTLDGEKVTVTDLEKIAGVVPQMDSTDRLAVSVYGSTGTAGAQAIPAGAYGMSVGGGGLAEALQDGYTNTVNLWTNKDGTAYIDTRVFEHIFNGSTWDRKRNNQALTLLASAARTSTTNSSDQTNYNGQGLILFVDVSSITDTPSITVTLQIKDSVSGDYFTVWTAAAALTATGEAAYLFVPGGAAGSYTEAVNLRVGRTWRISVTHGDADSITYSVSAVVLV